MALIELPRTGDPTIVYLRGEHDISTVAALASKLSRAIALSDADLTLDLSEVRFMDASTVGVIVRARAFLEPRLRTLTVRSATGSARRVVDFFHLAD